MNIEAASTYHRYLVITILISVLSIFLKNAPALQGLVGLSMWLANVYCCYKLALAIGKSPALWVVLGLIGFLLMCIPQLLLLNAANKVFRSQGMKIGLFGGATRVV